MTASSTASRPTRRRRPPPASARSAGWPASPSATAAARCWPGSAALVRRRRAVRRLRRRVHGRLLRARVGLEGRPRQLLEDRVPRPVRRHRRRGRPRRRRRSPRPRCEARSRTCSPSSARVPHVARRRRPVHRRPAASRPDGRTLVAHVRLDVVNPPSTCRSRTASSCSTSPTSATGHGFQVALGGQTIEQAEQGEIGSEGIGLAAAAIILLIMFGSVVAAGLPIVVAVAGLAVSSTLTDRASSPSSTRPTGRPRSPR